MYVLHVLQYVPVELTVTNQPIEIIYACLKHQLASIG